MDTVMNSWWGSLSQVAEQSSASVSQFTAQLQLTSPPASPVSPGGNCSTTGINRKSNKNDSQSQQQQQQQQQQYQQQQQQQQQQQSKKSQQKDTQETTANIYSHNKNNMSVSSAGSNKRKSYSSFLDDFFNPTTSTENLKGSSGTLQSTMMASSSSTVNNQSPNGCNNNNTSTGSFGSGNGGSPTLAQNNNNNTSSSSSNYLTDKLMERIFSMAVPTTTTETGEELQNILFRIEMQKSRPPLSVNVMSKNCILLLSRLSVPFEAIDSIVTIFSWTNPVMTLTFLSFVTLIILKLVVLLALPFFYICFEVIVPAFIKRHPLDPVTGIPTYGPALKKIDLPKPVPEISREFLLNVTDLQNHMVLYIVVWDFAIKWGVRFLYFKDEKITSFIFLSCLGAGCFISCFGTWMFMVCLPLIKLSAVLALWSFTVMMHPTYRDGLLALLYSEETRLGFVTWTNKLEHKLKQELKLRENKEIKELEIFELQNLNPDTHNWEVVCFTNEIYSVNSHCKLNTLPIAGTMQLANVKAPVGWAFLDGVDKQMKGINKVIDGWMLDLRPAEWVRDNFLNDVIEVDDDTKWCYDLHPKLETSQIGFGKNNKKVRGFFRRRRWVRSCIRDIYDPVKLTPDDTIEEIETSSDDETDGEGEAHNSDSSSQNSSRRNSSNTTDGEANAKTEETRVRKRDKFFKKRSSSRGSIASQSSDSSSNSTNGTHHHHHHRHRHEQHDHTHLLHKSGKKLGLLSHH
ncbi:unnamed protein product [Ambrosiozyma monospora]|uniref:Unnamed protein product n=1 Tax=Ambrosiozyma monospora TaxID=43982 RepID=A0A9W6YYP8_AMBMO|nr:unnamed protein product [Ambrosiozyma monospora]